MPHSTVRLSRKAEQWLQRYIIEIAEVNPQAARNILSRLERLTELLSSYPEMTERGSLPGTRKIYVRPLILTARCNAGVLEIAAIRHGRQNDIKMPASIGDSENLDS